jgi:DNA invertase Pin-like site-specific DNA recombinase
VYVFGRGRIDDTDPHHRGYILAETAAKSGWHVLQAYCDSAGTRPELKALQAAIMAGKIQALMLDDIAELGSIVVAVVETLAWLREQGVHLLCLHPIMDSGDRYGRAVLTLASHLAEFNADIRRGRLSNSPARTQTALYCREYHDLGRANVEASANYR